MYKSTKFHPYLFRPGWGLIDAILSIAVAAFIGLLVSSLSIIIITSGRAAYKVRAAAIADEQLSAIKRLDIDQLFDQTDGPPINILPNAGTWTITQNSSNLDPVASPCPPPSTGKHCSSEVLSLAGGSGFSNTVNGRLALPAGAYENTTIQASWYVHADSPSGWVYGMYLRSRDVKNGYRLKIASTTTDLVAGGAVQNVLLEKLVNGTATSLFVSSGAITVSTGTWISWRVVLNGSTISIYKDGVLLTGGTITDATSPWLSGPVALVGWNGVHLDIDDVTEVDPATCGANPDQCWDFTGETELPAAWVRVSSNDLPDSTATIFDDNLLVTLEPWPVGATDMKRVTVTVQWRDSRGDQTYSVVGYARKGGIGL